MNGLRNLAKTSTVLLIVLLIISACGQSSKQKVQQVSEVVEFIQNEYAPDSRLDLFSVNVRGDGKKVIVSGEVSDRQFRDALIDTLSRTFQSNLIDSILVLPAQDIQPLSYGIVYVSVAQMRRDPSNSAELVNQTIMGTVLRLYKKQGGFYLSQNWYRYLGWVSSASMVEVDSSTAADWQNSPQVICIANYGVVRSLRNSRSEIVTDLVSGAILKKIGESGNWVSVETPDGRRGYVQKNLVIDVEDFRKTKANNERIVYWAKKYLGIPYLWGGTTSYGFDCSGLTQTVFRMNNIDLPRDTNQMVLMGEEVDAGNNFSNLQPGDLVFFGAPNSRVTHVGIYIGDRQFIHADGWVHINSFDPEHELYNQYRHERFKTARRIITK